MNFVSEPEFTYRVDDPEEIILRQYQEESITALRENRRKGVKCQVLASMVGSGKTIIGAFLLRECWRKDKRGIFLVDRLNLLDQTSAVLDRYGLPHGVIQSGHPRYRPGELIQVASIQTLARRGWPDADLIINDECHVMTKTILDRISRRDSTDIIGLSATPFSKGMAKYYEALVNVTTGNKLTAEGFLVPFKVWAAKEPDMTGAKVVAGEWTDEEASKRSIKIVGDVVKEYETHGDSRKSIIFGVDVAHCEELQRKFFAAGINVALYTYQTGDEERQTMLQEFRKPDSSIRGLISVAALSRGFDVPDVGCIIMCRPLKNSFAEFIQILGRGLRSHPSKKDCYILDLAGNFSRHYPAMVEFFEEGAQSLDDGKPKPKKPAIPEAKKPRKCPNCSYLPILGDHCPACGYLCKRISKVQHEEGSLASFDGTATLKLDRAAKINLFAELRFICANRNYKRGWAAWKYRAMTGVWPAGPGMHEAEPYPPRRETLAAVDKLARRAPRKVTTGLVAPARGIPEPAAELDLFA